MDNNTPTSLTENEAAYLVAIIESDYGNGEPVNGDAGEIVGYPVWDWYPAQGFGKSARGIASSLVKKGLAHCEGSGDEATIEVTVDGLTAIRAYIQSEADGHLSRLKRKWAQDAI